MANLNGVAAPAAMPTATGTDWGAILAQAIPAVVQARYQDKVLAENLRREKAGLPLLDAENYQPGVKVGIDPGTRKMLIIGGSLAAGTLLIMFFATQAGNKKKGRTH